MQQDRVRQDRGAQYQNLMKLMGEPSTAHNADESSLKAARMRSIINSHRLVEAYREDSKVAYVSEQFPTELVFAFNAIPWNIESMAILLAPICGRGPIFQLTQERELSRDICSFLRGPCGMMLAECYPTPDIVLMNSQPCEGLSKMGYMSGKSYDAPFLALHLAEYGRRRLPDLSCQADGAHDVSDGRQARSGARAGFTAVRG